MFSRQHQVLIADRSGSVSLLRDREPMGTMLFLVIASAIISLVLVGTYGSIFSVLALIGGAVVIVLTFYDLYWGFLLFVGMVITFDQFPPRGYETSIIGIEYFQNLKAFNFLANVEAAVVTPMELQLFLLLIIWALLITMGKKVVLNRVPVWFLAVVFFIWLTISAIYGIGRGGDFLPALWELRALFYLGLMYFLVPQMIQTRKQLNGLVWVCITGIAFKAFQGIVRIVRLGFSFGERTELTNHEDPLFFVSLFFLLAALALFGCNIRQRKLLLWLFLPMFFVFVMAQRRATYGALGIALVAFMVLLPGKERLKMLKVFFPILIVFGMYLAAFWTSESSIGMPAQLIKSSFSSDQKSAGDRYYSNLYREFENYNLSKTVQKSPIIGIGFGNKYDQPISLAYIPFSLRDYIPHNEIFWLMVKMGAVGFFFFWLFFDAFIFQAAYVFARLKDPYLKSLCAVTIVAVLGQLIVSYFDLQLTYYRNMVYLGVVMGLLPTLELLDKSEQVLKQSTNEVAKAS